MAAIIPVPAQAQAGAASGGSSTSNDPLFHTLAKYVTTGAGATNITNKKLQEMIETTSQQAGGRAYLETLCQGGDSAPQGTVWHNDAACSGIIQLDKMSAELHIQVPSLQVKFEGSAVGFFPPYSGALLGGHCWYSEMADFQPGPADFTFSTFGLKLYIDVYRNQQHCACFTFTPVGFNMNNQTYSGAGTFA